MTERIQKKLAFLKSKFAIEALAIAAPVLARLHVETPSANEMTEYLLPSF